MNIGLITSRNRLDSIAVYYKEAFIEHILIAAVICGVLYVTKDYVTMIE